MERAGVTAGAESVYDEVIDLVDWTDVRHVVQVAGGSGGFLSALLRRLPDATGVLFDAPEVIAEAGPTLYAAGVADRVDCAGGDLFHDIPPGGDLYVIAHVLWGLTDDRVARVLRGCREVMAPTARLLLVESSTPPARACEGWSAVLHEAGFAFVSARNEALRWCVVEATPA
jgi:hypothetical protein